ncbi:MAG: DUF2845 domain-containing protein [Desulfobacterales bacterium]|nr:MAG: DUF2845 domain-containing protein [Desulfobacterales bacterium]
MSSKIILTLFIGTLIFSFGIQSNLMALDDISTMDCDGGIVAAGDSEDSVRKKCGEPQQVLSPDPQEPIKWVYDLGETYYVSVVNGKVERIQVGD